MDLPGLRALEAVCLRSSATPRQLVLDGWIVRLSPGKAKRARSVNAFDPTATALDEQLTRCAARYADAGLPLLFRITPFVSPADLDAQLARRGFTRFETTAVMTADLRAADGPAVARTPPAALDTITSDPAVAAIPFAPAIAAIAVEPAVAAIPFVPAVEAVPVERAVAAVAALRGSSAVDAAAHHERLHALPLVRQGFVLHDRGAPVCAGLVILDGGHVGLFDLVTAPSHRGRGLATAITAAMLAWGRRAGATTAYLQVDVDNAPARAIYRRHGFVDRYTYWYRAAP